MQTAGIVSLKYIVSVLIGIHFNLKVFTHHGHQCRQFWQKITMKYQGVQCVTDADTAGLGVGDDGFCLCQIRTGINIGVYDSGAGFDHRYAGIIAYKINQPFGAARDGQVNAVGRLKNVRQVFTLRWCEKYDGRINAMLEQDFMHDLHHHLVCIMGITAAFQYTGIQGFQA